MIFGKSEPGIEIFRFPGVIVHENFYFVLSLNPILCFDRCGIVSDKTVVSKLSFSTRRLGLKLLFLQIDAKKRTSLQSEGDMSKLLIYYLLCIGGNSLWWRKRSVTVYYRIFSYMIYAEDGGYILYKWV